MNRPAAEVLHRRVVHLEFASGELAGGLEWALGLRRGFFATLHTTTATPERITRNR